MAHLTVTVQAPYEQAVDHNFAVIQPQIIL